MTTNTAGGIIGKAYQDAGLLTRGGTVNATQLADGIDRLNDIINLEATQGLKLWLETDQSVILTATKATYTVKPGGDVSITRPLQVLQAYYLNTAAVKQPLTALSRDEYTRLSTVTTPGALNSYFVDKQATQFNVSFYNTPDATAATGTAHLILRTFPSNVAVTGDATGFPPEWAMYLRWALADDLATGQPQELQARCESRAARYREQLEGFDVEDAVTYFEPDARAQYFTNRFR